MREKLHQRRHVLGGKGIRQGRSKPIASQGMSNIDPTASEATLHVIIGHMDAKLANRDLRCGHHRREVQSGHNWHVLTRVW